MMLKGQKLMILHISPSYKPAYCYGGPIFSVASLCEAINGNGEFEVVVFTTTANGMQELDVERGCMQIIEGINVFFFSRLTKDHTHFSPGLLVALHRYLKKAGREKKQLLVHIHSWWNMVAVLSAAILLLHRMPLIISPRGMITNYTLSYRNIKIKWLLHTTFGKYLLKNAVLHATSNQEAENIKQHVPACKISVIPNLLTINAENTSAATAVLKHPANLRKNTPVLHRKQKILNLLFLSRIDPKKGLEVLLVALSKVRFHWALTIAGSGTETYVEILRQQAAALKISGKIKWIGQVSNELKYQLLSTKDLLVLPSSNENFGNVVLESLLVGTPVLISDTVGLAYYVSKSDLGWICAPDSDKLAKALVEINENTEKRNKIRSQGPKRVRLDFSSDKIMQDYLKLYRKTLNNSL